jgi:hypothetical protein
MRKTPSDISPHITRDDEEFGSESVKDDDQARIIIMECTDTYQCFYAFYEGIGEGQGFPSMVQKMKEGIPSSRDPYSSSTPEVFVKNMIGLTIWSWSEW